MNRAFSAEANIALRTATSMQKFRLRYGAKVYLGHEKREGWKGELPFYLFVCHKCECYAKDYPHGHVERQYLLCSHCDARHGFTPLWARAIVFGNA